MSSDTLYIKRLRPKVTNPSGNFTRPADVTAYAAGDLVANSTAFGSVVPVSITVTEAPGGQTSLRRIVLRKSTVVITGAAFRVHMFRTTAPTVANGDNGAISMTGAANYIGSFSIGLMQAFTDGAVGFGVPSVGGEVLLKLASGTVVHCLIEALGAYTPGNAEVFTITLEGAEQ